MSRQEQRRYLLEWHERGGNYGELADYLAAEVTKTRCCVMTKSGKHQRDCPRVRAVKAEEIAEAAIEEAAALDGLLDQEFGVGPWSEPAEVRELRERLKALQP